MARVLVIGGTAFLGRALVERLLARGDDVTLMHRGSGSPYGASVAEIHCDRNDTAAVADALRGTHFDVVYDNVYDWQRGTTAEQVAAAATAVAGLGRYVFTSSVAAYGGGTDHDEDDALAPDDHPDRYAREKAATERLLFRLHAETGLPASTLRPAFVYGPHNPFEREAFFWDRILRGRPVIVPGDGERLMQFIAADEVARAAIAAAARDVALGRAYNLAGDPVTQNAFVRALATVAGREPRLVHVARDRIEAAGGGLMEPPLYFGAYLDLPPLTVRNDRLAAELDIRPAPLEESLRDAFAWYRGQDRPEPDFAWEDALLALAT